MRRFYHCPTATVDATPPTGLWMATVCPGLPAWSLVLVDHWASHEAQDTWEALPGVVEHYPENMGQPAPAAVIAALGPWGVTAGMTLRQVYAQIRANWAVWRH